MLDPKPAARSGRAALVLLAVGGSLVWAVRADVGRSQDPGSPEIVGPGAISTPAIEHGAAFTRDGRRMYFTRQTGRWGDPDGRSTIYVTSREHGSWSAPTPAPFSGEYDDSDAFISPDERKLFFVSTRPSPGGRGGGRDLWVWALEGEPDRKPRPLAGDVNTPGDEYSPVLSGSETLYFASTRAGGFGQGDLYAAARSEDGFGPARNLGSTVNGPFGEWNLVVDSGERFIIFEASGRALNRSMPGDLYVSFRDADGWLPAAPIADVNTPGSDLMPRLSPEGETLYFASTLTIRGTHSDIFRIELAPLLSRARQEDRSMLLAVSRSDHHLAVIDPQTLTIERRLPTGPGPHEVAALPGGRAIVAEYGIFPRPHDEPVDAHPGFATHPAGNTVRIVDLQGENEPHTLGLPACERSHGILASVDGSTAWATCEEEAAVVEIDLTERRATRRWETGHTGSHRLVSTHDDRYLIVANVGAGNVTVIDREEATSIALATGRGSEGLALSSSGTVWVLASGDRRLSEVDPARGEILRSFPTGDVFPISVALDEEEGAAWIAHMGPRAVDLLDLDTGERIDRIPFDTGPLRILLVPQSRHVYVSLPRENAIAVVDRSRREVVGHVRGIMEVDGLAWVEVGRP